jgi:hypothetical protein
MNRPRRVTLGPRATILDLTQSLGNALRAGPILPGAKPAFPLFLAMESRVPALLSPRAAEALAVKTYLQVRTSAASLNDVLAACLAEYQNPIAAEVMAFQIQIAASESTDLEFAPAVFRPQPASR